MEQKKREEVTLQSIDTRLAVLCNTTDIMRKDYNKFIYALIAVVAAQFGMKFISTPWYIDLAVYLAELSGVFVLLHLICTWKESSIATKIMRIVVVTIWLFSSGAQTIIFRPDNEPPPTWYLPILNGLLIVLAIAVSWLSWRHKTKADPAEKPKEKEC